MLDFRPVDLSDRQLVAQYTEQLNDISCQHAFVSMYGFSRKYGDYICESGGFLFVLRTKLCDDRYRVYLAPLGKGDIVSAFNAIISDAHSNGRLAKFVTLTRDHADILNAAFPGRFDFSERRELAEYIFSVKKLAEFPGSEFQRKRREYNHFLRLYGDKLSFEDVSADNLPELLEYEDEWVELNAESHDESDILCERENIRRLLPLRNELGLMGRVMRIDGKVRGFFLGFALCEDCFDCIFEKSDKSLAYSYRAMMREIGAFCSGRYKYMNAEEDLGIEGLRSMKLSYYPDIILQKYIAAERYEKADD